MNPQLTTFPARSELDKALQAVQALGLTYEQVTPEPAYHRVGLPALVLAGEAAGTLRVQAPGAFVASGWVDYRPAAHPIPATEPPEFAEDVFGQAAIVVLAPCVADLRKLRLIVHLSGDLAPVFPFLNTDMPQATYNHHAGTLTFMDGPRMISLYAHRLTLAKTDDIVDSWRAIEAIRCRVNDVWRRRGEIQPSDAMRQKPPALEIYKRLPGTSCGQCGEKTCMAFALRLWSGETSPDRCAPIFAGAHGHLKEPLLAICAGLGVVPADPAVGEVQA